ncbi:MAG: N-acetylmuramoyl-L-alanine amidase [Anaerolineales bacterium]|jgi:N-acetylmuramoyl-L-alanine amidase
MNKETTSTSSSSVQNITSTPKSSSGGMFRQLQLVIVVAFVLATLFTAWTEPGLLPGGLSEKLSSALALQRTTPQVEYPTTTPRTNPRIGIVAGHSGNDSGAVCSDALGGSHEVDINLNVASLVREDLVAQGYNVDLLAEFDPRLTGYHALALVSIHADSCEYINDQATGFKVSAAISTKYPEQAARLTTCIRTRYAETTGLQFHSGSVTGDMTNYHAFSEISTDTPAAIIETGFMNLDREILTQHPDVIANGIASGILCFVRNEDVSSTQVP